MEVAPYRYRPGKGAEITDGPCIVAIVLGTSYPIGSACEADYALARKMAAAPELLTALKDAHQYVLDYKKCDNHGLLHDMAAAIAKAEGRA